jgi:high affinity Mn2+ porin
MRFIFSIVTVLLFSLSAAAQDTASSIHKDTVSKQRVNIHFQTTYIYQYQPAFNAPYTGTNSLRPEEDKENSVTATLFLGVRLWKGAEIYIDPEIAGGSGLSGAFGLAASTNGETFRVGNPAPTLYLGRGYIKQTIALGSGSTPVDDGENQLAGSAPKNYLQFMLGKYSLGDIFDNNTVSNSPRTQFMNWALMNNAAWDYAANVRGYTYAFTTILQSGSMTYKAALATLPTVANGPDLNTTISQSYALNAEVDRAYKIDDKDGHVRLLGYYNRADMGSYKEAIAHADTSVPNVISTRKEGRGKVGFGLNADQQITDAISVFGRLGWNDGKNETWCFTEADETISLGINVNGKNWKRKNDNVALAVVSNGLSQEHREYLADGGLGFQLGDGRLNYGQETAAELYYSYSATSGIWLTGDYQFILNPGYNVDRGPVSVFSVRVHVEL